ncbi:General stress protein 16O [Streptomyces sp. YIM 130001]|uniref:TraR/DksA family transcriptional regulator n=1 Tax=Streptomyces sp. YIM 130001 TaxID=2259644 RepID=UPI000E6561DD|nr:TraR/DksA C4-type zinc finger protein [Streptomyces sp. YIM 130001]RII09348.1 General stress protein 16O [Streptomyces sp. YIM 130001]
MSLDMVGPEPRPERFAVEEIRRSLEHERDSRLAQLRVIDDEARDAEQDFVWAQRESIQRVLRDIETAFARLERGEYGVCEDCSKPIPVERLDILPYARHCVSCCRRRAS